MSWTVSLWAVTPCTSSVCSTRVVDVNVGVVHKDHAFFMGSSKLAVWVNSNLSFRDEVRRIFGRTLPRGSCYCLWHQGFSGDTPAAKVYDETNSMHCFGSCNRTYTVYNLLWSFDRERLHAIARSGVIPEEGVTFRGMPTEVLPVSSLAIPDVPQGIEPGSFEYYQWLSQL